MFWLFLGVFFGLKAWAACARAVRSVRNQRQADEMFRRVLVEEQRRRKAFDAWLREHRRNERPWQRTLGLKTMPNTFDELKSAYRRACMTVHPDAGGTSARFQMVTAAFEQARRDLGWERRRCA